MSKDFLTHKAKELRSLAQTITDAANLLEGKKKPAGGVRVMSKDARERIAAAQRKRWAKSRKAPKAA